MAKTRHAKAISQPAKTSSKAGGSAKKQGTKERGALLSFLLVLVGLHGIFATFLAYNNLKQGYLGSPSLILTVLTLVSLADVLAAFGMWYWKKWAIYLYAATRVIATAIHLMLTGSLLVVFYDLLPVSILGYVINLQSKQDLFT